MKTILNGIFNENPVAVLLLGLCSTLAVTNKVENAYLMGICVIVVMILSEISISLIRKLVPENVKIPTYIIIVGTFVTVLELLLATYVKPLYDVLGIYLPLIVVNCIVLGRCIQTASKENVLKSTLDGFGIGLGYTFVLLIISVIREVLGSNTITLMDSISTLTGYKAVYQIFPTSDFFPIRFLVEPAGAFLTLALFIAFVNYMKSKGGKHESN